ncbi:DUF6582 domain-containing protein [Mycobacterium botniense]|uniref:Mu-like prophage I protein n=1 Tax=Mycobacterium botniense TaxID=84962 RepID=A0A7I9XT53_9MYCO|nr:DUF6582 domain-containing protein [Mycobacterium botniense]GFG72700.1 hypothetical protein MBOT_00650 [Mycobacterium botniense]
MVNLVTVPGVELMRTGKWNLSTGEWECTEKEIAAAIEAHEKGILRKPVIRLGHNDPRFSGDPAVGWLDNLRASEDGRALIGDMVGVPEWLAEILPSAYPSRSIEGLYDYTAPDGSVHEFVLTGLALLGATRPGVESLQSLQDVARLYDIAAAGRMGGKAIELVIQGSDAPRPYGDVKYADPKNGKYPIDTAERVRAAWAYINMPKNQKDYSAAELAKIKDRIKSAAKKFGIKISDDDDDDDGGKTEAATNSDTERGSIVALSPDIAEAIGVDASADEDTILTKIAELKQRADAAKVTASGADNGLVQIEQAQLDELKAAAAQGVEARARQIAEEDERIVMAAIQQGKIAPARKQHWLDSLRADREGTKQVLESLAAGLIPTSEIGHQGVRGQVGFEAAPDPEQEAKERVHARIMASLGIPTKKASVN